MPDERMNYGSMDEMEKSFRNAHQQLEDTLREMEKVAKTMEDGVLLGHTGDAFRDALRGKLQQRLQALSEKMTELAGDIQGAVAFNRDGVTTARSRFK